MNEESKRSKFVRIAEGRTNAVIAKIRTLAKCANPYAYEYTEEDVRQIFAAIEQELRAARARFSQSQVDEAPAFKLKDRL